MPKLCPFRSFYGKLGKNYLIIRIRQGKHLKITGRIFTPVSAKANNLCFQDIPVHYNLFPTLVMNESYYETITFTNLNFAVFNFSAKI